MYKSNVKIFKFILWTLATLLAILFILKVTTNPESTSNQIEDADYYVAPWGKDSNPGTKDEPFATVQKAHDMAQPGELIYLRGGNYNPTQVTRFVNSGTEAAPIRLFAYPGELPVINGSDLVDEESHLWWFSSDSAHWHVKGIHLTNAKNNGIYITNNANHLTFEAGVTSYNGQNGESEGDGIRAMDNAHHLTILNWDSHHNANKVGPNKYDNGDGFVINSNGEGNRLIGVRAWNNSDDGVDLNFATKPVTIEQSWSAYNGFDDAKGTISGTPNARLGDGVGFKIGGYAPSRGTKPTTHRITRSVAWGNAYVGFDENDNGAPQNVFNNTSWHNGKGFDFDKADSKLRNNISHNSNGNWLSTKNSIANSWDSNLGFKITDEDFISLDDRDALGARQRDGSLPVTDFLKLASTSDLIDKGVEVGLPYKGKAPDLGAFEMR